MTRRVAYLGSLYAPGGSGVERAVRGQFLALASRNPAGFRLYAGADEAAACGVPQGTDLRPMPRWAARARGLRILWEQLVLPALLRRDPPALLHAPAYVAPLLAGVPVILNAYDLHVFTHPGTCAAANRLHYRALLPRSLRKARTVLVPSAKVRDTLLARFPECAGRVRVVPPGVDGRFLRPADGGFAGRAAALRSRHGLPGRFLLFVGNLAPRKNLDLLARADLPFPVALAGRDCGAKPRDVGGGRIIPLGRVSDDDLADLYRMAFALVHPAIDEGFGLTLAEAMACGCPVVSSPAVAPELLPGVAAVAETPAGYAGAVRALAADPVERENAVHRGLGIARGLTWERAAEAVEEIYRQEPGTRG